MFKQLWKYVTYENSVYSKKLTLKKRILEDEINPDYEKDGLPWMVY